jgi:hypothetical protein
MRADFLRLRALRAACALAAVFVCDTATAADPLPRVDPARAGFSAAGLQRIDRFFADEMGRNQIPGAVVAIAREGRLVYYKAIGFQDRAANVPMKNAAGYRRDQRLGRRLHLERRERNDLLGGPERAARGRHDDRRSRRDPQILSRADVRAGVRRDGEIGVPGRLQRSMRATGPMPHERIG